MGHVFLFIALTTLWFLPGIVVRSILEKRAETAKAEAQAKAIARLYPKGPEIP